MSKKSIVLLSGLGLAAAAAGAYFVLRRGDSTEGIEHAGPAGDIAETAVPLTREWTADDDTALSGELSAAVDDEPVNIR